MGNRLAKSFNCPTEFTLQVLGGKWKTVILCYLKVRPLRYAELRKLIPKLSDKMLSQRLRDLTDAGSSPTQSLTVTKPKSMPWQRGPSHCRAF